MPVTGLPDEREQSGLRRPSAWDPWRGTLPPRGPPGQHGAARRSVSTAGGNVALGAGPGDTGRAVCPGDGARGLGGGRKARGRCHPAWEAPGKTSLSLSRRRHGLGRGLVSFPCCPSQLGREGQQRLWSRDRPACECRGREEGSEPAEAPSAERTVQASPGSPSPPNTGRR